jgi:hypothetical protein
MLILCVLLSMLFEKPGTHDTSKLKVGREEIISYTTGEGIDLPSVILKTNVA